MALNESRLNVTEFDFDEVKANLKLFLKGQTEFKDYDFEGSGMNILLDVLAYNTHYLGYNANMLANEMFLDSAALRSSIVSHAKMLGYTPSSVSAPVATIDVTLNNSGLASATINAGTKFSTTVNNTTYNFVTVSDITTLSTDGILRFNDLKIYESALELAEVRFVGVKSSFLQGDKPAIDTLESMIQVQNRQITVNDASVVYENSSRVLSNFLWYQNELPVEVSDLLRPPFYK